MKKRRRWTWRILLSLFLLALILYACSAILALSWRNVPINPATTHITAPLASDGSPDYLAALNADLSKNITDQNNAAPQMLALLIDEPEYPAWFAAEKRLLNIQPPAVPKFISFHHWCLDHLASLPNPQQTNEDDFEHAEWVATHTTPWSPNDHPVLAAYLIANQQTLDALENLTTKDRFFIPFVTEDGLDKNAPRPALLSVHEELGCFRELANAMDQRALLRLHQGDSPGFEADSLAVLRLAYLLQQQHSIFTFLVGSAIHELAMTTIEHAAASPDLSPDILRDLQSKVDRFPPFPSPDKMMDTWDRYLLLDELISILNRVKYGPPPSSSPAAGSAPPSSPGVNIPLLPIHFELAFRKANQLYDANLAAISLPAFSDRTAAIALIDNELPSLDSGSIPYKMANAWIVILDRIAPLSINSYNNVQTKNVARRRLTQVALALASYRRAHRKNPAALSDLPLPADSLLDPFTAKTFIYNPQPTGYLLYSLGPDLVDNAGKPQSPALEKSGYDITANFPPLPLKSP